LAVDGGCGIRSMPDRLDAEVHEVCGTGELDDREEHGRLGDECTDAQRDGGDERDHAQCIAEDAEQAAEAPEREGAADDE
jgi:hypothetical protein